MTEEMETKEETSEIEESLSKGLQKKSSKKNSSSTVLNIELHDGEELSDEFAHIITGRTQTRVVVLAGDSESGKTTLLSAIYENFLRGPFAGFSFAGSQTLMGFERRSWRARVSSNASKADTDRTISGEQNLLHLLLRENDAEAKVFHNILLLDISGEDYREARTSAEACLKLQKLKRADHLALLIDGEKILDNVQRHEAFRNSRQLLQRFLDMGMLPPEPNIHVLVTKYDKIQPYESDKTVRDFLQNAQLVFENSFAKQVGTLQFYKIASRPQTPSTLKPSHGFENFFPYWVKNTPFIYNTASIQQPYNVKPSREFDRYLQRRLPELSTNSL